MHIGIACLRCLVNARVTRTTACRLAALRVCFRSHRFGVDLVLPGLGRLTAGGGRGESCFEELGKDMVEQVLRTRSDGGGVYMGFVEAGRGPGRAPDVFPGAAESSSLWSHVR